MLEAPDGRAGIGLMFADGHTCEAYFPRDTGWAHLLLLAETLHSMGEERQPR